MRAFSAMWNRLRDLTGQSRRTAKRSSQRTNPLLNGRRALLECLEERALLSIDGTPLQDPSLPADTRVWLSDDMVLPPWKYSDDTTGGSSSASPSPSESGSKKPDPDPTKTFTPKPDPTKTTAPPTPQPTPTKTKPPKPTPTPTPTVTPSAAPKQVVQATMTPVGARTEAVAATATGSGDSGAAGALVSWLAGLLGL